MSTWPDRVETVLGVFDALKVMRGNGPMPRADLAIESGVSPLMLRKLLPALESIGVLEREVRKTAAGTDGVSRWMLTDEWNGEI